MLRVIPGSASRGPDRRDESRLELGVPDPEDGAHHPLAHPDHATGSHLLEQAGSPGGSETVARNSCCLLSK